MKQEDLSGLILTKGGDRVLPVVDQLAKVCGQVVVVHHVGSEQSQPLSSELLQDGVVEVVERAFDTFPRQRNAGLDKALGKWVLSIDDDELLSDELVEELRTIQPEDGVSVFSIPRTETILDRELTQGFLHSKRHPRLFHSSHRYMPLPATHAEFHNYDYDTMSQLTGAIMHYPSESPYELIKKSYAYGRLDARLGMRPTYQWRTVVANLPRAILIDQFWRDGLPGLVAASANFSGHLGAKLP